MSKKIKVAFQGEKGAYSHLACLEVFPKAETVGCSTFEEAFQLAKDDLEYRIIIPIENSLAGRVADIHYLIPKLQTQRHEVILNESYVLVYENTYNISLSKHITIFAVHECKNGIN